MYIRFFSLQILVFGLAFPVGDPEGGGEWIDIHSSSICARMYIHIAVYTVYVCIFTHIYAHTDR